MKKILLILTLLLSGTTFVIAKDSDKPLSIQKNESGQYYFEKVVDVPGTSQEELYKRVKEWVMSNVKTSDNNIVFDDKTFEKIVTTPTLAVENVNQIKNQKTNFKVTILFKENKLKIQASSFIYYGENYMMNEIYNSPLDLLKIQRVFPNPTNKVIAQVDKSFAAFEAALEGSAKQAASKSDW